jgi:hypothetical protein
VSTLEKKALVELLNDSQNRETELQAALASSREECERLKAELAREVADHTYRDYGDRMRAEAERLRGALKRILHTVETSVPYTPPEAMGALWALVRQDARRALKGETTP